MRNIASFAVFFITAVILINYIVNSTQIHKEAVEKELIITEASKTFMDTITDKGALSERDYSVLVNHLARTGGSFKVTLTVERLYAIPDGNSGYVNEYRPSFGFTSDNPSLFPWKDATNTTGGSQYFKKFDLATITIEQTSMMSYQTNMMRQLGQTPTLRTWSFSRGVRSSGNSIVNNEMPPIDYN